MLPKNKLSENKAQLSQIFDWYKVDFKEGVVVFINKYISTGIALDPKAKVTYLGNLTFASNQRTLSSFHLKYNSLN